MLADGYARYSKHGRPFATPNCTFEPEVIIPPRHLAWLLSQPASVLNPFPVRDEIVGLKYLAPSVVCEDRMLHDAVLLGPLTRRLGDFTARNAEVIDEALPKVWQRGVESSAEGGGDPSWRGVKVFDMLQDVVVRMTARSLFGAELAGDERLVASLSRHGTLVAISAGLSRLFAPPPVRFIVAPLIALPANVNAWWCGRWLLPLIRQKLDKATGSDVNSEEKSILDYVVDASLDSADMRNRDPKVIASRMLLILFAAMNTTLFTVVWALVHLSAASNNDELMHKLRQEAEITLAEEPVGTWTRSKLADLKAHDSVIRETLRHTGFGGRSLMHRVMKDGGVALPSGERLPKGSWVGLSIWGVHHDEETYETSETWDGLRFTQKDSEHQAEAADTEKQYQDKIIAENKETVLERRQKSLVTTTNTFLAFSHGRHAW